MGTGGTLPTQVIQTVSFYNTTGVIERDKNIYFCPRVTDTPDMLKISNQPVNVWFKSMFDRNVTTSTSYNNVSISNWSPQDKVLRVKGNADDFRLISEEGEALNYFILKRRVIKENTDNTYYYGFFITGVSQVGLGTIELTYDLDHFTNVFYLHNKTLLNDYNVEYDMFNEKMKNCYVKRQHYDRAVRISRGLRALNHDIFLNTDETYKFKYQYRDSREDLTINENEIERYTTEELELINAETPIEELPEYLVNKMLQSSLYFFVVELKDSEVFNPIEFKSYYNGSLSSTDYLVFKRGGQPISSNLVRTAPLVWSPMIKTPSFLSFYKSKLETANLFRIRIDGLTADKQFKLLDAPEKIIRAGMGSQILSMYYVKDLPFSQTKISYELIDFNEIQNNLVQLVIDVDLPFSGGNNISYIRYEEGDVIPVSVNTIQSSNLVFDSLEDLNETKIKEVNRLEITHTSDQPNDELSYSVDYINKADKGQVLMFMTCVSESLPIRIDIKEEIPDLKTNYYEPILEAEPYSFYSLSYLNYELPMNKNRYYSSYNRVTGKYSLDLSFYISFNGAIKGGIIPSYTVEGKSTRYINEGLTFTISSFLPINSDSYRTFYYQNMSQMKNQYAVKDFQSGTDLLQSMFNTGPANVGAGAVKGYFSGGGAGAAGGAISTGISEISGQIDSLIDWAQSKHVIGLNQKSLLADVGRKPDTVAQSGSDVYYDLSVNEMGLKLNHYRIDTRSYNSIAKLLERTGYSVNLYDKLNAFDRVGWNYIQLISFDYEACLTKEQEDAIRLIFNTGVTLLHVKSFLTEGHNYETIFYERG